MKKRPYTHEFTLVDGKKIYECQRRAKRNYRERNRLRWKLERVGERRCALCEIFLRERPDRSRKYCTVCRSQYRKDVRSLWPSNKEKGLRQRPWQKVDIKKPAPVEVGDKKPTSR